MTYDERVYRIPIMTSIYSAEEHGNFTEIAKSYLEKGDDYASKLYRSGQIELCPLPAPKSAFTYGGGIDKTVNLDLTEEQEMILSEAEICVMDAHISAPTMINTKEAVQPHHQHLFNNIKWVQNTYAGSDPYYRVLQMMKERGESTIPKFTATRAGGVMPMALAQYVLGYIISIERKFTTAKEFQQKHQYAKAPLHYRRFRSLRVGILGFGDIGQAMGKLFKDAEFQVTGFKRHMPEDGGASLSHCSHKITSDLNEVLSTSDFVISVLPSTNETHYLLNESNLPLCAEKKPVFLNVGRGDVISEDTIVNALDNGWLSQAVLDVFEQEPLSEDSKLWDHPKVHLTPHVAGMSFPEDSAEVFVSNLNAYLNGEMLKYKVNWELGY